jgi:hypothetical protein
VGGYAPVPICWKTAKSVVFASGVQKGVMKLGVSRGNEVGLQ